MGPTIIFSNINCSRRKNNFDFIFIFCRST